jgi:transaldolase
MASVASFFVSRVDTEIDNRLDGVKKPELKGKSAIANAKLAYQLFLERFSTSRWKALEAKGARVQRPLWASTSTKNPSYRDVIYVEELIGPRSINTMPPQTVDAFRDHGNVKRTVDANADKAREELAALEKAGISMPDVTEKLLVDGLASFQKSYDSVVAGIARKRELVAAR